ncbi:MAG: (4Fe-4S)-binding protein [Ekhidna sp.]|uniref:(4Fe-4S)-binding protein n=1 Tax=Ekhidna sp. TaxID=2608089 RepID=UPI0032F05AF3
MAEKIKEYESKELTVIWQPEKCIHSENCFKGLPKVFNPNQRPWVNVDGAADQTIKNQIDKCPSGALSYRLHAGSDEDQIDEEQIVEVAKNGPLMVYGNIKVKHHDGAETSKHRVTAFCRCGASGNKPYCDGSHKKINFEG